VPQRIVRGCIVIGSGEDELLPIIEEGNERRCEERNQDLKSSDVDSDAVVHFLLLLLLALLIDGAMEHERSTTGTLEAQNSLIKNAQYPFQTIHVLNLKCHIWILEEEVRHKKDTSKATLINRPSAGLWQRDFWISASVE